MTAIGNRTRWPLLAALTLILVAGAGCANLQSRWPQDKRQILAVLNAQAAAWNRGDLDEFMRGYSKWGELTFTSASGTERGWQATYDRYKARYPTPAEMGALTFSDLEPRPLGERAALVLGRWRLDRGDRSIGGSFSLIFQNVKGNWLISHDHTSLDDPTPAARSAGA